MCLSPFLSPPEQFQKTPTRQKIDGNFWITVSVRDSHMLTLYLKHVPLIIATGSIQILMFFGSFNLTLMYFVHFHYEIFQIFLKFGCNINTHLFYLIFEIMVSIYEYWTLVPHHWIDKTWSYANTECLQLYWYCLRSAGGKSHPPYLTS